MELDKVVSQFINYRLIRIKESVSSGSEVESWIARMDENCVIFHNVTRGQTEARRQLGCQLRQIAEHGDVIQALPDVIRERVSEILMGWYHTLYNQ